MRRLVLVALVVLGGGCPAGDARVSTATFGTDGAVNGARSVDDKAGGRVTCTVDRDPDDAIDSSPLFTLAIAGKSNGHDAPGAYITVRGFGGAGAYVLGAASGDSRGWALFFDSATVEECAQPDDTRCFVAEEGCNLSIDSWSLGEVVAPGVRNGVGSGSFDCAALENAATQKTVALVQGTFTCRASDWTETH